MTSEMLLRELWLLESGLWSSLVEQVMGPLFVIGHLCAQRRCDRIATHRCFWPGGTASASCNSHRADLERFARFMGFDLRSTTLEVRDPDPSAARFAAMELY